MSSILNMMIDKMDTMNKEIKGVRGTKGNKKEYAEVLYIYKIIDIKGNFNYKRGNGRKKKENE